jgi:EpsD family peptidyl-prolyl cis-trans isomerase
MKTSLTPTLFVLLIAFMISGCGGDGRGKSASQVAARVNGNEISVHQINLSLIRQGPVNPEQAKTAMPQVLERLIDQQLLVQKAKKAKLDRDVQIMQLIEAAKSQILAQAYMERVLSTAPKVTPEDIRTFYKESPALFSERRIYRFEEIVTQVPEDKIEQLREQVRRSKTISEVANWLKTQSIQFAGNSAVRAAEQLPMGMLPELSRMKDGEMVMRRGTSGITIVHLAASHGAAMNEQQATPFIQTYLLNRKRMELADSWMKELRAAAKIEYVGDFGKSKPASASLTDQLPGAYLSEERKVGQAHLGKDLGGLR